MKDIIDVSRYQGAIDWVKVAASGTVGGAMLKTVSTNSKYGGIYVDPTFEANYAGCKANGIPVGVYYYTYATTQATADKELAKLKEALAGKTFELPIATDVEDDKLKSLSKSALTSLVAYEAKTIEDWGVYSMVYTYKSFAETELNMDDLAAYDLWLAYYGKTRPTRTHGMWQYTSTGSVVGISGNVDMSHPYKEYPSIIRRAGLTQVRE